MPRFRRTLVNPRDLVQIAELLSEIQPILDEGISFGHPQDPASDTSTTRAGSGHQGTLENVQGAWCEIEVDTAPGAGAAITCTHNLDLEVPVSGEPNVRWTVWGMSHNGTGTPASANVTVYFEEGDTVGADAIELTVGVAGLTVSDANPLKITLFFIPAVRFPA